MICSVHVRLHLSASVGPPPFYTDIHGPQRMNSADFSSDLTELLVTLSSAHMILTD